MRDPYEILGVTKSASEAEIKKAFRGLAKKHHPDTHGGDEKAAKKFQEISGAYDLLGDKEKRAKFDSGEIGAAGNRRGFDPRAHGGRGGPFGGGHEFYQEWGGPGGAAGGEQAQGFRAEDIFADLFGGLGGGRGRRNQPMKGEDFAYAMTVAFDEAAKGSTRRLTLPDGREIEHLPLPDDYTTNLCFGGPDLRTAYITLSGTGRLVAMALPPPGPPLHLLNRWGRAAALSPLPQP